MSRPVYGRVYELNLSAPAADEEHPYVGMTTGTIHQRVHGRQDSAHTSARSIAKDPWKARILPGRAGYRCLETVYDTGNAVENDRNLRRAEAYWIDRLRPKHNDVRPIRPFADEPQPGKRATARPAKLTTVRRRRRPIRVRAVLCLIFMLTAATVTARAALLADVPWTARVIVSALGAWLGWLLFWRLHRAFRKLVR